MIMSDAVQMLEEQHAEVTALFMKLERLSDPVTCEHLFRTIDLKLRDHTVIEEEIFYPAVRERAGKGGDERVRDAVHDHDDVKKALAEAEAVSPTDYTFKSKVSEVKRLVEHHVREEKEEILPLARRLFTEPELDEMALRMQQLMSIHAPIYQIGGSKLQTAARDTLRNIGDFVSKIGG